MKNLILSAALAGAAAGGVVMLGGNLLSDGGNAPTRTASATPSVQPASGSELEARLAKLENRLDTLEIRPSSVVESSRTAIGGESAMEIANLREELDGLKQLTRVLERPASDEVPIDLQLKVESALGSIREQEEKERDLRREQAFNERLEQRLLEVAKELGLSGYQVDELRRIETENRTKRDEMMAAAREADDWGSMREAMGTLRDEQRESLVGLFGEELYGQYNELVGRGGLSGGGGRGGFGGGGAQGGGGRRGN